MKISGTAGADPSVYHEHSGADQGFSCQKERPRPAAVWAGLVSPDTPAWLPRSELADVRGRRAGGLAEDGVGVYLPVVGLWALLKQDGEDLGHVAGVDEGAQAAGVVSAPGVLRNELRRDPDDGVDKGGGPDQGRRDARASPERHRQWELATVARTNGRVVRRKFCSGLSDAVARARSAAPSYASSSAQADACGSMSVTPAESAASWTLAAISVDH